MKLLMYSLVHTHIYTHTTHTHTCIHKYHLCCLFTVTYKTSQEQPRSTSVVYLIGPDFPIKLPNGYVASENCSIYVKIIEPIFIYVYSYTEL